MRLSFPRLVIAITFLAIAAMALRVAADTDTWWQVRTGQWIVEHQTIPRTDPFSATRLGQPWLYPATAWLSEVVLYGLFAGLGYAGLNLFTAGLVVLTFVWVYQAMTGPALLRAFLLVWAAAVSAVFWSARPQMVSLLFSSLTAYLLHQYQQGRYRFVWLLPPLMAVWANTHAGFGLGLILMALTGAGLGLTRAWTRWGPASTPGDFVSPAHPRLRPLLWAAAGSAVAVMINPLGPALWRYPFQTVSMGALRDLIQEWQSPNFHDLRFQLFLGLFVLTLVVLACSPRRATAAEILMVGGVGYLGFLAGRNVPLLALVAPPVLSRHLTVLLDHAPAMPMARRPATAPLPIGLQTGLNWFLLGLASLATLVRLGLILPTAVNEAELSRSLPLGAAAYLRHEHPPGPLFNSYNFGGYLLWALYPEYPVYVDGRTDLYDDTFLQGYLDIALTRPGYQAALDARGVRVVLVETTSLLAYRLAENPGWRQAYGDSTAVVFVRELVP